MRKKGFTLAELLVTLAIIGVAAALTIPGINKILPDRDKGIVLKTYKQIIDINNEIFNDPSLYRLGTPVEGSNSPCTSILTCTAKPDNKESKEGVLKYIELFKNRLSVVESDSTYNLISGYSFKTSDGLTWKFIGKNFDNPSSGNKYYTITINTGDKSKQDCVYSKTCTNPRQFKFKVDKEGALTGVDPLTRAYLLNPHNLHDRTADLKKACELAN